MDGNKDEALKCLKIGKDALESGDRARAAKFISKARRLDPCLPVDDLFSSLDGQNTDNLSKEGESGGNDDGGGGGGGGSVRRRVPVNGSSSKGSETSSAAYTEEQVVVVREIRRKKDYYEILGLERGCSVEDVRKAYRKLSLKVHPDKNKAPGAEEAFKAVGKAFKCLSDEESRKKYDVVGDDEPVYERRVNRRARQGFGNGFYYDGDDDAEEIFRNFFYGGMNQRGPVQFNGFSFGPGVGVRMGGNGGSEGFSVRTLVQLLPIILFLLFSFMPSNEPVYSLSRSYNYQHRFTTQKGVNYFVKSANFEEEYPSGGPDRARLEQLVERDYYSIISQNCRLELERFQWGFIRETPNCDLLKQFRAMA